MEDTLRPYLKQLLVEFLISLKTTGETDDLASPSLSSSSSSRTHISGNDGDENRPSLSGPVLTVVKGDVDDNGLEKNDNDDNDNDDNDDAGGEGDENCSRENPNANVSASAPPPTADEISKASADDIVGDENGSCRVVSDGDKAAVMDDGGDDGNDDVGDDASKKKDDTGDDGNDDVGDDAGKNKDVVDDDTGKNKDDDGNDVVVPDQDDGYDGDYISVVGINTSDGKANGENKSKETPRAMADPEDSIPQAWKNEIDKMSKGELSQAIDKIKAALQKGKNSDGTVGVGKKVFFITKITSIKLADVCCAI